MNFSNDSSYYETSFEVESPMSALVSGIVMMVTSFVGLIFNGMVMRYFLDTVRLKKEPALILVANLILTDVGHLLMILSHYGPELIWPDIEWGWYQIFVDHGGITFWYSSLCNIFFISISRYIAVVKYQKFNTLFTFKCTVIVCFCAWLICVCAAFIPLTGRVCCARVFDIHVDDKDYDESANKFNVMKTIIFCLNFVEIFWLVFCYTRVIWKLSKVNKVCDVPVSFTVGQSGPNVTVNVENMIKLKKLEMKRKKSLKLSLQFIAFTLNFILLTTVWFIDALHGHTLVTLYLQRLLYCLNCVATSVVFFVTNCDMRREITTCFYC